MLSLETRVPLVLSECFDIVQVGYDIFKNFDPANFEILEIQRCPEGAEIGSRDKNVFLLIMFYAFLDNFNEFLKILHKI